MRRLRLGRAAMGEPRLEARPRSAVDHVDAPAVARSPAAAILGRAAARLYERWGAAGSSAACVVISVTVALATTAVTVIWMSRYLGATNSEAIRFLAVASAVILACLAASVAPYLKTIREGIRLTESSDPADAARAWDIAERVPRAIVLRASWTVSAAVVPLAGFATLTIEEPAWVAVPIALSILAGVLADAVVASFISELLIRPAKEHVAKRLPASFEPPGRDLRLQTKAILPLPIVTLFAALTVGAFADISSGPERLAVVLAIAIAVAAVAAAIFLVISSSALGPLQDLAEATRRVARNDLEAHVPVVTTDDLGELTTGFNQMVAGLHERESLRERNLEQAEELRASRARIVAATDAERRRLERDLHDGAQQHLVLLNLKLGALRRKLEDQPELAASVDELRDDLGRALADLRDLAHGIYPPLLENEGLPGALADASARAGIPTSFDPDGVGRYAPEIEAAVYFCCLEALQNASKHAGDGATASLRIAERDGGLSFVIADDGRGFDPTSAAANGGIQNMSDRIGALAGHLTVASKPGAGTRVAGEIPIARASILDAGRAQA